VKVTDDRLAVARAVLEEAWQHFGRGDHVGEYELAMIIESLPEPEPLPAPTGPDATAVLRELFALIEDGTLVRDISRDAEPGWAMRQLPLVQALARAKQILDDAPQPPAEMQPHGGGGE